MKEHLTCIVPGCAPASTTMEVVSPYDGSLLATCDLADGATVERALANATRVFANGTDDFKLPQRLAVLQDAAAIMESEFDSLAKVAASEGGKPLFDSKVEVNRAIDGMKLCIETMRQDGGEVIPMGINAASAGKVAFTRKEPIGVVVAVSAFNHPLNLIVHQVAPAIATGCPVIVKPAGKTPLSCFRFVQILQEAGLPEGWCQALVTGSNELSSKLATDERVGFLSFIGSARVGWMLRSQLAPGTRCALEHGGVAPVIVAQDADCDKAIAKLVKGGFYHAGQVCVSVQRVYVHESIAEEFSSKITAAAKELKVGDPTLEDTEVGPLIDPKEVARIHQWVEEAVEGGATLLAGGAPLSKTCYQCTILLNPPEFAAVSRKEIFGPVICLYTYSAIEDAIQKANQLPYAFQAAVFTQDIDRAMQVYSQINGSAVMVNEHTAFRVDWMPFAGLRHSGLGVGGIPHTIRDMQVEKMLVISSSHL